MSVCYYVFKVIFVCNQNTTNRQGGRWCYVEKSHDEFEKIYSAYKGQETTRWTLPNQVLYDLCKKYPTHTDADEITAKLWVIGRCFAAAIERRKNAKKDTGKDFYYDVVVPEILKCGAQIDAKISSLQKEAKPQDALAAHKFLMNVFTKATDMENRSLASKYLHFHCPQAFFIYDGVASGALRKLVKKSACKIEGDFDEEYRDFFCRALALQAYIGENYGEMLPPNKIDSFLLYCANKVF